MFYVLGPYKCLRKWLMETSATHKCKNVHIYIYSERAFSHHHFGQIYVQIYIYIDPVQQWKFNVLERVGVCNAVSCTFFGIVHSCCNALILSLSLSLTLPHPLSLFLGRFSSLPFYLVCKLKKKTFSNIIKPLIVLKVTNR